MSRHSEWYMNGKADKCALCGYGFSTEGDEYVAYEGDDGRLYCCEEHADFGLDALEEYKKSHQ